MHKAQLAQELYMNDHDQEFITIDHRPGHPPDRKLDRTWVQLVLRYARSFDSFACPAGPGDRDGMIYTPSVGWTVDQPNSGRIYGNAWPWHSGRLNIAHVDGSVTSAPVAKLTAGCQVKVAWKGQIDDLGQYMWDLH